MAASPIYERPRPLCSGSRSPSRTPEQARRTKMPRYLAVAPARAEGIPVTLGADEAATAQPFHVPSGQRLVAVVNNGSWQVALDVTFPENLKRIMRRRSDG